MAKTTIIIIGGGACGVAAFIELTLQLKLAALHKKTRLVIVEKSGEIGRGLAFGTQQPGHLLNTQADLMGIYSCEPDHFSEWLQARKSEVKSEVKGDRIDPDNVHTTRRLYSDYLREQFDLFYGRAVQEGLEVDIVYDEALHLKKTASQWRIGLASGISLEGKYVILAPGTPKPNNYPLLESVPTYIDFPWPSKPLLEKIPSEAQVGILGTSLSAVDAVMTLADHGHEGDIILFSPDGLLPRVQPPDDKNYQRKFLTLAAIHKIKREHMRSPRTTELFRLFQQEATHYEGRGRDWKAAGAVNHSAEHYLDEDIKIAETGGDAFINILYSLRYDVETIWRWLSVAEKEKFKHWLGSHWNRNRHGMPLENARRIKKLLQTGKLLTIGKFSQADFSATLNKFIITYDEDKTMAVDFVINATGPGNTVAEMKSALIQNLYKAGIVEPYSLGGIKIDPDTMRVVSSRMKTENLYAVGHLCNGILPDVNSVWFNVKTISRICRHVLKRLRHAAL